MKLNKRLIIRIPKRICLVILSLMVFWSSCGESLAKESMAEQPRELVFVLDGSQSMQNADAQLGAAEFIRELTASLPTNYRVGIRRVLNYLGVLSIKAILGIG